jgi:hypothetical protein
VNRQNKHPDHTIWSRLKFLSLEQRDGGDIRQHLWRTHSCVRHDPDADVFATQPLAGNMKLESGSRHRLKLQ